MLLMRFDNRGSQERALTALKSVEEHLADGVGWVAVPMSNVEPIQALSVVQAVAQSLSGELVTGTG